MTKWQELIKRYAGGRPICNCGDAYYSLCGHEISIDEAGRRIERFDAPACPHGCSANQIMAKEYIATKVLEDLGGQVAEIPELNSAKHCPACGMKGESTDVCLECQQVKWRFLVEYVRVGMESQMKRTCPTCKFTWYEKTFSEIA